MSDPEQPDQPDADLLASVPDAALPHTAVIAAGHQGEVRFWSEGAALMFGIPPQDAVGRQAGELPTTPRALIAQLPEFRRRLLAHERFVVECPFRRTDGSEFEGRLEVEGHWDAAGQYAGSVTIVTDVTRERAAAAALRASEARWQTLLENAPQNIQVVDRDRRIVAINWTFPGVTADHVIGSSVLDWVPPDAREMVADRISRVFETGAGTIWETAVVIPDGGRRWFSTSAGPIPGPDGTIDRVLLIASEVTDVHNAREALEEREVQVRQLQKTEALGRLAGGVAHDFNNLLQVILGYTALAQADVPETSPTAESLAEIDRAATRASELVRQLLLFARRVPSEPEIVDVNAELASIRPMLRRLLGARIAVEVAIDESAGPVQIDAGQLQQVIVNLAVNARDAMPSGGTITISTETVRVPPGSETEALGSGEYLAIAIRDTGTGISPEALGRIFEPFFTTKEPGKGTGLGLAVVDGIVRDAGGSISVAAPEGGGTLVRIVFPTVPGAIADPLAGLRVEAPGVAADGSGVPLRDRDEPAGTIGS